MILEITQDDINNGLRGEPASCPVALALVRELHAESAAVTRDHAHVLPKPRKFLFWEFERPMRSFILSNKASAFVTSFDAYNDAQPTKLMLFEQI